MGFAEQSEGPSDRGYWVLAASERSRSKVDGGDQRELPLEVWVKRILASTRWPLFPSPERSARPKVREGDRALVYVAAPVKKLVARAVLGGGPSRSRDAPDVLTIPLEDVDSLGPLADPRDLGRTWFQGGVSSIDKTMFDEAVAASLGTEPWRPDWLDIEPVRHIVTRCVIVDSDTMVELREESPWPTVDKLGRLRFDLWRCDREESRVDAPLDRDPASEGSPDWDPEHTRLGREPFDALQRVEAVDKDGERRDISAKALTEALVAHNAAETPVLTPDDVRRYGLEARD